MEGFTPNASTFGQNVNPSSTSFGANETSHPNQSWSARGGGARGGSRGRGTRGNTARGSTASTRGKPFSNRSAVFNTANQNATTEENEEQSGSSTFLQPESSTSGFFQSSFDEFSAKPVPESVNHSFPQEEEDNGFQPADDGQLNALGGNKESDQDRKHRFENLPKQNRFFEMRSQRETLRAKYIREGILPDPEKPTDLTEAKTLTGTCMEMCPDFEREEREFQNEGDTLEMFPGTNRIDPTLAVKIYRRPAAGRELPLPEDVRPPEVLRMTLDYLLHQLLPSDPGSPIFTSVQPFMWNRTRAIRQDFIVQGDGGELAIECHERIARYHILCLHWRGGVGAEGWSEQQELEQLRKTIRSLTEFYEDIRRKKGIISPNEAEFRSYNLLLHMQDPETLREAEGLPTSILQADCVQVALKIRAYAQRSNNVLRRGRPLNTEATMNLWTRFFRELQRNPHVNYLLACLAENVFSLVRAGALKAMSKTYNVQHAPLPLDYVKRSLGLDEEEEARSFAIELGAEEALDPNGKLIGLRLRQVNDDKALPSSPFSKTIVEARRGRYTTQDVVDAVQAAIPPLPTGKPTSAILSTSTISAFPPTPLQQDTQNAPVSSLSAKAPAFLPSVPDVQTPKPITKFPQPAPLQPNISTNTITATKPTPSIWPSQGAAFPSLVPKEKPFDTNSFSFAKPQEPKSASASKTNPPVKLSEAPSAIANTFSSFSKQNVQIDEVKVQPSQPTLPQDIPRDSKEKDANTTTQPAPTVFSTTLPPKPTAKAAPVVPKRTIRSVTNGLVARLIQEVVTKKVNSITEQACLREARLRQSESRTILIQECSDHLCSMMLDETVSNILASQTGEVLSDEMYSRKLTAIQWHRWRNALSRARLRNHQNARLLELRKKLQTPTNNKPLKTNNSDRHILMEVDDNSMQSNLIHARNHREDMWMRSTFFLSIVAAFEDLLPPDISTWTIGFSSPVNSDSQSSTQWLRTKLSIDREPHAEIVLRSDTLVHMMDLQKSKEVDISDERELGLILFELDERVTNDWKNASSWAKEKDRLQILSESEMIKKGKFVPKLMLICWTKDDSGENTASSLRRAIIKRLGLGALDANRYAWSQVEIWNVSQDGLSPQIGFEKHLQSLRVPIEYAKSHRSLLLDDIVTVCMAPLRSMLERIELCISRLVQIAQRYREEGTVLQHSLQATLRSAFEISTLLTQRVLSDILSVSEVVPDENVFEQDVEIPIPSKSAKEQVMMVNPFSLALSQLSDMEAKFIEQGKDDAAISLVQTWLIEQSKNIKFPWSEYFDRLLYVYVDELQSRWIETMFATTEEIETNVQSSKRLFEEAANEIETKVRKIILDQPVQLNNHNKRRSQSDDLSKDLDYIHGERPVAKLRRTHGDVKPEKAAVVEPPSSSAIASLRSLISSANHMLDQR
ncbi:hypothetical protein L7F22_037233 [Adiantum nelumboides]|nr:hypothetical protein [Adiantum nelumboides]